jgi:3-hydroxybutyryl-CoA dehydrogenase
MDKEISKIAVMGAGIMGAGIAQTVASQGIQVSMRDIEQKFVDSGMAAIKANLGRAVKKGKMKEEDMAEILGRVKGTLDVEEAVKGADVVIEAIVENMELKKSVFKQLDEICAEHAILASNTSSLSITEMASACKKERQDKVVGMHFFNPVPVMPLVEVVRSLMTSNETVDKIKGLATKLGKTPVEANDSPGFIANRVALPMLNEAMYALMEGVATKEDIDKAMKLGYNHPMGPLELTDLVGLDTALSVLEVFYKEFGDPKYRPCPLLRQMVRAGHLGRKTGKGFYEYK